MATRWSQAGDTSWAGARTLATSSDVGVVSTPWVGADTQGNVTALWARGTIGSLVAESSRRAPGTSNWNPAGVLPVGSVTTMPAAGVNPQGHATLAWTDSQLFFGPWSSSSSILDPIAPDLRDLNVPETAKVGEPVTVSVSPFDISPVTTTWQFGDGAEASGATAVHRFTSPGERTVTVKGVDAAGNVAQATRTIAVAPVQGPEDPPRNHHDPPRTPDPTPDPPVRTPDLVVAPKLTDFQQSSSRWATRKVRGSKLRVGTTFRFRLNRAAQVRLSFERILDGRRAGKKCAKPTKQNRKRAKCQRFQNRGTLRVDGKAGSNSVSFRGRVGGRTLPTGRYRVRVTASADGKTSRTSTRTFTIGR